MSEAMERAVEAAARAELRSALQASDNWSEAAITEISDRLWENYAHGIRAALRAAFPILAEELVAKVVAERGGWALSDWEAGYDRGIDSAVDCLRTRISEIAGGRDG